MPEMKEYIFANFEMKKIISMERSNNTAQVECLEN